MGHKYPLGLPTTIKWKKLVEELIHFSDEEDSKEIAKQITDNVASRFNAIARDKGILAITEFFTELAKSFDQKNPIGYLGSKGIEVKGDITPISVALSLKKWISDNQESKEYSAIGREAATKAILKWFKNKETGQQEIFETTFDQYEKWRPLSTGSGFCELTTLYYGFFTDKYLKYFLDREATKRIPNITARNRLDNEISKHSQEVAKVTQSFAAGWFNKIIDKEIGKKEIKGYVKHSFEKLREALKQEVQ